MKVTAWKTTGYPMYYYLKIPFEWKDKAKELKGFWLADKKVWRFSANGAKLREIEAAFGDSLLWKGEKETFVCVAAPFVENKLTNNGEAALLALEQEMILRRMSWRTIKGYKQCFRAYLLHLGDENVDLKGKDDIKAYLIELIRQWNISESYQNSVINAIKFYYEKVLGVASQYIDVPRPKATEEQPELLSPKELHRLFSVVDNPKHKLILKLIYGGGLRLGEVCNLLVTDVNVGELNLFVKAGKGKKDRYTLLSERTLPELQDYLSDFAPKHWLFEGASGGRYSERSVQEIFRKAVTKAAVNPYATVHTLRHSFATHLVRNGTPLNVVQNLLGHADPKTTERYLHITTAHRYAIRSPLDEI